MKISEIYKNNKRSLSFEIFPPKKDTELSSIDETLKVLCELNPDFISVTFGAGGSANSNRTIEIAKNIKHNYGIEPVVHLTSLHYDRSEIDAFASAMREAGIENILALRGDRSPNAPEKKIGSTQTIHIPIAPIKMILFSTVVRYSVVGLPGRIPGMNPPCLFMLLEISNGLKVTDV